MPLIRVRHDRRPQPRRDQGAAGGHASHAGLSLQDPQRDRYQIIHEHPTSHFIVEDTGLGITRTRKCVVIQITTRPRDRRRRKLLQPALPRVGVDVRIPPSDVVVSMVTNSDEDWSFGTAARNS